MMRRNANTTTSKLVLRLSMLMMLMIGAVGAAHAQWTSSSGVIYTTNTSDKVGIGTTNPFAALDVANKFTVTSDAVISWGGSGDYGRLSWDTGKAMIYGLSGKALSLGADGAPDKLWIATSGNVGIGTTSPREKLDIATDFGPLRIYGRGGVDQPAIWYNTYYNGSTWVRDYSSYGRSAMQFHASGHLLFLTGGVADGYPPERMRIDNAGNVGIGTMTPGANLAVSASSPTIDAIETVQAADSRIFQIAAASQHLIFRASNDAHSAFTSGLGIARNGGVEIGSAYVASYTPPANGAIIEGKVGIGTTSPGYKLDVNGNTNVTGNLNITANGAGTGNIVAAGTINAKYQDVAEWVPSSEQLPAGTVVVLDSTKANQVTSSTVSYDTRVAGVVSEQPGIALGEKSEGKVLVATTGRVRVKVDATKSPIHIGDLLVTSDVPGVAMKSEPVEFAGRKMHMPGTIIGKAQEPLEKGKGEIVVLLSLQ